MISFLFGEVEISDWLVFSGRFSDKKADDVGFGGGKLPKRSEFPMRASTEGGNGIDTFATMP